MEERQHPLRESSSAGLRRRQKLEILPSLNSKSLDAYICGAHTFFIGREDFNGRLATVIYYETRTFLMRRRYFIYAQIFWIDANVMGANISWTQIFQWAQIVHGREYFMGANISWARIFLLKANILCKLLF